MVIWGCSPGHYCSPTSLNSSGDRPFIFELVGVGEPAFIPVFLWMLGMPFTILAPLICAVACRHLCGYMDMFDVWLMVIVGVGRSAPA